MSATVHYLPTANGPVFPRNGALFLFAADHAPMQHMLGTVPFGTPRAAPFWVVV